MYFYSVKKNSGNFIGVDYSKWREKAEASLKGKSLSDLEGARFDGMPLPMIVPEADNPLVLPPKHVSLRSDLGHAWEISSTFSTKESLMIVISHAVESVRTDAH